VAQVHGFVTGLTVLLECILRHFGNSKRKIFPSVHRASRHKRAQPVQENSDARHRQETPMSRPLLRLLKAIQKPVPRSRKTSRPTDLQVIRSALRQCVDDCQGIAIDRLALRITSAQTHQELWMLRSDAYRLIALSHCQSVAAQRIGSLLRHFDGWVAPREVRRSL
jgi:hypothetical protein